MASPCAGARNPIRNGYPKRLERKAGGLCRQDDWYAHYGYTRRVSSAVSKPAFQDSVKSGPRRYNWYLHAARVIDPRPRRRGQEPCPSPDALLWAGRAPPNCAFPEDAGLSRQHFAFEPDGEEAGPCRIWAARTAPSSTTFRSRRDLMLKPGDRITAGHLVIVFAPRMAKLRDQRVVVFEGGEDKHRITTVVTSLEGALSNQTMVLERGGRQGLGADAGADSRRPGAFGKQAAGRAVPGDSRSGDSGRQRAARRAAHSRRRETGSARAQGRRIPHRTDRARPRDQREDLDSGARRAARRRFQAAA